ncbi:transporter substrate-binding domain-containing protein [Streptococcus macacae]|uniref:ABC transporter, substrate-binding protein, family 3 n=1 Tax=Streptococcus macacae NCTC 11558 TaxID=764298 RepID=G5JU35_9STRE|nr:transporter substrate-binding domain-containing protein [Streptococcus macacae]EHJ53357.1 ABC transporter, substrate-binding protein, family 3 [Streptococcus macacae NCTC 11558]SUN78400.1 amino acid ABC transporter substrate-binding protein [Streptococcus macacae NCTC 11558]
MSKKKWIVAGGVLVLLVGGTLIGRYLAGNGSNGKVTTLKVAHTQNYAPYDYVNDKGESTGYEVEVLKAVDKKLPDYKFKYTGTSDEDLLIGLESGKYDIGTKGAWYTKERAKKFIFPKDALGASVIGFTIRKDDKKRIKDIDSFAKSGGKLVPISPQNAQWNVIEDYNSKHKDSPIALKSAESFTVADAYAWVLEGRYDAYFDIKLSFEQAVKDKKGAYHKYADKLTWVPYKGIETYPLIHRNKANKKFAKAYDKAIKELKKDGTLSKLSKKYFGENVFNYVTK